jgi:hypothetical protein
MGSQSSGRGLPSERPLARRASRSHEEPSERDPGAATSGCAIRIGFVGCNRRPGGFVLAIVLALFAARLGYALHFAVLISHLVAAVRDRTAIG